VGTHHSRIAELSFNLVEAAMAVKAHVKGKRKGPFLLIEELTFRVEALERLLNLPVSRETDDDVLRTEDETHEEEG